MRALIAIFAIGMATSVTGCVAAAVNTSTYAIKAMPRSELQPRADAGDAAAQYELGKSWCCMGPGFDTQTATEWFCKSARQGNVDAMYELGRVYLGEISRTPAPGQKLRRALTAQTSPVHAHLWLSMAAAGGHELAASRLARLSESMTDEGRAASEKLAAAWRDAPCDHRAVFGE